jgi:hypothetical protein
MVVIREKVWRHTVLIICMMGNTGVDSMSSINKSGCDCCDASYVITALGVEEKLECVPRHDRPQPVARLKLRKSTRRVSSLTITALSPTVLHADAGPARRAATSTSQNIQCRVLLRPGEDHFPPFP